ncbi:hypothetical protein FWF89_02355 [Candidatus Saccharibacteria bacterium]|nr:hypothetical protein [Candidatus Saccharibacteria bacterium]
MEQQPIYFTESQDERRLVMMNLMQIAELVQEVKPAEGDFDSSKALADITFVLLDLVGTLTGGTQQIQQAANAAGLTDMKNFTDRVAEILRSIEETA